MAPSLGLTPRQRDQQGDAVDEGVRAEAVGLTAREMASSADAALIDDALAAVDDARRKAPRDFVLALAAVLGSLAIALLAGAALAGGAVRDLLLNLASEVLGAWLTVVLIDGLWKRMEAGGSASLDSISTALETRRGSALTDDERQAWRTFVHEYGQLERSRSLLDRARAVPRYASHLRELEARGNRTLEQFDPGNH
jgi:hypothetical protein